MKVGVGVVNKKRAREKKGRAKLEKWSSEKEVGQTLYMDQEKVLATKSESEWAKS